MNRWKEETRGRGDDGQMMSRTDKDKYDGHTQMWGIRRNSLS